MSMMLQEFCEVVGIKALPVGIYDAPNAGDFSPLVPLKRCIFEHYGDWQSGATVVIAAETKGCPGCGHWLVGKGRFPSREVMVSFLTDKEGLRESSQLTEAWLEAHPTSTPRNGNICIGPVREEFRQFLKTVTFFVTPDQLSVLIYGANYHAYPQDPEPVLASFGSGCGLMLQMLPDLSAAQAMIGATDIAMREHLPPELLSFTVTIPMLDRLLSLNDGHSFLTKPFLQKLNAARAS